MATNKMEIDIYVKSSTEAQEEKDSVVGKSEEVQGLSTSKTTYNNSAKQAKKFIKAQTISVFLHNTKDLITSNIGLVTGRSDIQQRVDLGIDLVQKSTQVGANAMLGAQIATGLGVSKGVGAVAAIALTVASYAINIAFAQIQLNLQAQLEDKQITNTKSHLGTWYNKSRAGV